MDDPRPNFPDVQGKEDYWEYFYKVNSYINHCYRTKIKIKKLKLTNIHWSWKDRIIYYIRYEHKFAADMGLWKIPISHII